MEVIDISYSLLLKSVLPSGLGAISHHLLRPKKELLTVHPTTDALFILMFLMLTQFRAKKLFRGTYLEANFRAVSGLTCWAFTSFNIDVNSQPAGR